MKIGCDHCLVSPLEPDLLLNLDICINSKYDYDHDEWVN